MTELREWLVSVRPGARVGDEAAALQRLLLPVPGVRLVRLQATSTGAVAIIGATAETMERLRRDHADSLVIAPNSKLSMF